MISSRFGKHFEGIVELRKKLEEAMRVTDSFGRDARAIMRILEKIKDSESDDDTDPPSAPMSQYGEVSPGKY